MTPRFIVGSRSFSARRLPQSAMRSMILGLELVLAGVSAGAASAQGPTPAEVADYLGTWTLSVDFQGNPAEQTLEIVERQGGVKAALRSAHMPKMWVAENRTLPSTCQRMTVRQVSSVNGKRRS